MSNLKENILKITIEEYPKAKIMETIEERKRGQLETKMLNILDNEDPRELLSRYSEYSTKEQWDELINKMKKDSIENNFFDKEELER